MTTEPGCVVVGAGLAAANFVQALRENGYAGAVTLIGDEQDRPYERPPLSKEFLQGKADRGSMFVHDPGWYAENDIVARFGETVNAIDRHARTVTLASGDTLPYAQLVLATGATPRTLALPGADLAGVHTLRRIADSQTLREGFAAGARVVLIGAGWIGLEVAAAGRLAGAEVTVLETAPLPLQQVMGDELAEYFAALHRSNGVDLRLGVMVTEIVGDADVVTGVRAGAEVIGADLVVIGVGAVPNTGLAEAAGLAVDNGVLVDEQLRTADPAIWAIGDVANAMNVALGRRIRVEHWDNAIRQGKLAAATVTGAADTYDWAPYFFTDQFDLGMEYVGYPGTGAAEAADTEVVIRGDRDGGEFIAFWLTDGTVRAAMNVNIWDVSDDLRALISRDIDPARLADTDIELTDL